MAFAAKWAMCPGCGSSTPLDREARLAKRLRCEACDDFFELLPELLLPEADPPYMRHVQLPARVQVGEGFVELRPLIYDQALLGGLTALNLALIPLAGLHMNDAAALGISTMTGALTWNLNRRERRQRIELAPGRLIVVSPAPREVPLARLAGLRVYPDHLWIDFDGAPSLQLGQHVHLRSDHLRALAWRLRLLLARSRA